MKKPFKDTVVGKLLLGVASTVNPTLGKVLEGVTDKTSYTRNNQSRYTT